jgi:hypothetical protein
MSQSQERIWELFHINRSPKLAIFTRGIITTQGRFIGGMHLDSEELC